MEKKGSITVFLALILSLLLSLVVTGMHSVQVAAARTQILNSMDIGLYSLFGQYDRFLLKNYDLFFLDGTQGGSNLNLAAVYDNLESYMKPVLKQNSQKLYLKQGGFTGYRLATDENGEVFYQQAVTYMKDTLGSQGVQALLKRYKSKEDKVKQAEQDGKQTEDGNALENYDAEMDSAAQKSQEAEDASKNEVPDEFGDGVTENEFTDGEVKPQVINPIPVIQRIRQMGLLGLVVPASKGISDRQVYARELLSGRDRQQGMEMPQSVAKDNSASSKVLFQQYLMEHLGNYTDPSKAGLGYQLEYLLAGKKSDYENLEKVVKDATNGEGCDTFFECSGAAVPAMQMTDITRVRGKICIVSVHKKPHEVNLREVNFKEQTVVGTRVYTKEEFGRAAELTKELETELEKIVTHVVPLKESDKVFDMIADPECGTIKIVVDCENV